MAKKKSSTKEQIEKFRNEVTGLMERGYETLMPYAGTMAGATEPCVGSVSTGSPSYLERVDSREIGGHGMRCAMGVFDGKQSAPKATPSGVGTPKRGYIPWGPNDNLPNQIFQYANALPYTASALKYITDLTVALGPALMYRWTGYINGTLREELVPYEDAGVLIRGRMRDIRAKLAEREDGKKQEGEESPQLGVPGGEGGGVPGETRVDEHTIHLSDYRVKRPAPVPTGETPRPKLDPGSYEEELYLLEQDLKVWETTCAKYRTFMENNNVEHHYQKCIVDDSHMDIYFPTYGLSQGRTGYWDPEIVSIGHLPAVCTRMEQMGPDWRVHYVYFSEKWRQDATPELEQQDMVAYPALMPDHAVSDLREAVEKNRNTALKKRPLWFCSPNLYPSMLKPYYPQPAWWSIFPSQVYNYASNLVGDKAAARENSTMWGKIIFINLSYLKQLFDQMGVTEPQEMERIKKGIYQKVENFLQKRENNGKVLFSDSFLTNNDTELWKAIEIVDVPQPTSGADTKEELEEISSIIFFAMGIHPALIGAVPGKSGSTGGTFQRELHLLKQQQVSPRQRIYLRFLQNICRFNRWDPHAEWIIRQQVLTTLDRNANGLEDTHSAQ